MTKDIPEISPCPFCGSKAEIHEGVLYGHYVECTQCDASLGFKVGVCKEVNGDFDGVGDAMRAWNTRAAPKVKPGGFIVALSDDEPWVKELPWENFDAYTYWAHSVVGTYRIEDRGTGVVLRRGEEIIRYIDENGEDWGAWPSVEKAQFAAQADFSTRILSALEGH